MPRIYHKPMVVGPESIDAVGHVNNREYLRWMEEVAVEHSNAQGWPMERYFADQTAWFEGRPMRITYLGPDSGPSVRAGRPGAQGGIRS